MEPEFQALGEDTHREPGAVRGACPLLRAVLSMTQDGRPHPPFQIQGVQLRCYRVLPGDSGWQETQDLDLVISLQSSFSPVSTLSRSLACIISANPRSTVLLGILLEMGNWSSGGRMHAQVAQLQDLLLDPHGKGQWIDVGSG